MIPHPSRHLLSLLSQEHPVWHTPPGSSTQRLDDCHPPWRKPSSPEESAVMTRKNAQQGTPTIWVTYRDPRVPCWKGLYQVIMLLWAGSGRGFCFHQAPGPGYWREALIMKLAVSALLDLSLLLGLGGQGKRAGKAGYRQHLFPSGACSQDSRVTPTRVF